MKKLKIAIDGHSSCGKSTVAKQLARRFGFMFIDTGAMYRCATLVALRGGHIRGGEVDELALAQDLEGIRIAFDWNAETQTNRTLLDGQDVEQEIRGMEVANWVSEVSKIRAVRQQMVALQRQMSQSRSVVLDGRDIGTVVFPDADLKVFMTASPEVRAQRRHAELRAKGDTTSLEEVLQNLVMRDREDQGRAESPLRKAEGALELDSTHLTPEQQLEILALKIEALLAE